jgi:hypothetical protein
MPQRRRPGSLAEEKLFFLASWAAQQDPRPSRRPNSSPYPSGLTATTTDEEREF